MSKQKNSTRVFDGAVVITNAISNKGTANSWANDAQIKINGEIKNVTLWTASVEKPKYEVCERVNCKVSVKDDGSIYFNRFVVDDELLDDISI